MAGGGGTRTRPGTWVVVAVVAALVVAAVVALAGGGAPAGDVPPGERVAVPVPLPAAAVTGLDAPGIGLSTDEVTDLGLRADDTLDVPSDARTVGWYERSASPGTVGPAVLAAHVDYRGERGLFARLADVRAGDRVEVEREDDTVAVFAVDRVGQFAKDAFPTEEVYGPTPDAQIRLVTCGGDFDEERHSYDDNVVVFGHLESAYRAG